VFRVQQCTDQNQMVREEIQKYIDEHIATSNEDDARDFIDAYLLEIKHHKHEKNTLFTGK
jgi:hydrogenase maturation factor HypE